MKKRITPIPQVVGDGRHYEFGDDVDFSKFVTFYWAQAKMLNSSIMLKEIYFSEQNPQCVFYYFLSPRYKTLKRVWMFSFLDYFSFTDQWPYCLIYWKKWKFRLLSPLQQPILNWSSSFVLCLMPGCNMFGEVMASHIILRSTTTTKYVTGKPYTLYADQFSRQKWSILR